MPLVLSDTLKLSEVVRVTERMQTLLVLEVRLPMVMTGNAVKGPQYPDGIHSFLAALRPRTAYSIYPSVTFADQSTMILYPKC